MANPVKETAGSGDHVQRLVEVGLTPTEARVYVALLEVGHGRPAELAMRAGVPRQKVYEALHVLEEHGFCASEAGRVVQYRAVAADSAVPAWLRERENDRRLTAEREERLGAELVRHLPAPPSESPTSDVDSTLETFVGPARTNEVLERMAAAAERTLDIVQPPPFVQPRSRWNIAEAAALQRGVRVRVIHTPEGLELPERVLGLLRSGGEVRVVEGLPMKMIVRDGVEAAVALVDPVTGKQRITSALIRHPALVAPLGALFESEWKRGRNVMLGTDGKVVVNDR